MDEGNVAELPGHHQSKTVSTDYDEVVIQPAKRLTEKLEELEEEKRKG